MLQLGHTYPIVCYVNDAAFQSCVLMARDLRRLMSTLVVTCHHIWMAQAPGSDDSRRTMRQLPRACEERGRGVEVCVCVGGRRAVVVEKLRRTVTAGREREHDFLHRHNQQFSCPR
ncbi:hypothetical protein AAFF_G00035290 [Aldrovandia affinis]|uniref:Uncharacterized protein n=1 Tax=Aldrovandia affinis TaxID=143900 RepID=A0AAD7S3C5_9TELE|nr:hypothetical protein AAFF_G00035290 [Aldrovandia affinis]